MPLTLQHQCMTNTRLRTCSRCGQEFVGIGGTYVCEACRKPKPTQTDYSGKPLTVREKQIITLVSQALSNKEIAWQLHLSEGTVKEYLSVIYKKLGIQNRTGLALWAMATAPAVATVCLSRQA